MNKIIYISGPLRPIPSLGLTRDMNIKVAEDEARRWFDRGYSIICPHTQSRTWHDWVACEADEDKFVEQVDKPIIEVVDILVAVGPFYQSKGSMMEIQHAWRVGIPCITHAPSENEDFYYCVDEAGRKIVDIFFYDKVITL